jgi:hypothetical protein
MPVFNILQDGFVFLITIPGQSADVDKLVGYSLEGRDDNDRGFCLIINDLTDLPDALRGA